MEDVRLGRSTAYGFSVVSCPVAVQTQIAQYDAQRITLTIMVTAAKDVTIAPEGVNPNVSGGVTLAAGQRMVTFTVADHGLVVTKKWSALGVGGTAVVTVITGSLEKQ